MPRYLIERRIPQAGRLTAVELQALAEQSSRVERELGAGIEWLHSAITAERMVCFYIADDEAILREHARRSGLPVERISEVSAVIGPLSDDLK